MAKQDSLNKFKSHITETLQKYGDCNILKLNDLLKGNKDSLRYTLTQLENDFYISKHKIEGKSYRLYRFEKLFQYETNKVSWEDHHKCFYNLVIAGRKHEND